MVRIIFFFLLSVLSLSLFPGHNNSVVKTENYKLNFDGESGQKPVLTHAKLDSVLNSFDLIPASGLSHLYIQISNCNQLQQINSSKYYLIKGTDIFRYIVGHFRIGDLMSKDTFYNLNLDKLPDGENQYWLMDRSELHAFLDLVLTMRKLGLNDSALHINHGHRHPAYNKKVGGVSGSYHQMGIAIDIKVGDVDRNGSADKSDKAKVLEILEKEIIGNRGGLGLYPKSDVVHFDVRGYRARWNSHN